MATFTDTTTTKHWAWGDPSRPRWLLINVMSDWWGDNGPSRYGQDRAQSWTWCRSATSRNLQRCCSEAEAFRRMDLARDLWQKRLDNGRMNLDKTMDTWVQEVAALTNPTVNINKHNIGWNFQPSTKEQLDTPHNRHTSDIRNNIRGLERLLSMRFKLNVITNTRVTTTTMEDLP